ncbi:MAG: terpene synthase family protein [Dehalococcoidia bacterium]
MQMTKSADIASDRVDAASIADRLRAMESPYLSSWTREAYHALALTAAAVTPKLDGWASACPEINRGRILPLVLSIAAAAPFCSPAAIESTARMSLWVFALDDMFDDQRYMDGELIRRAKHYQSIAIGTATADPSDPMAAVLQEVRSDLASYPLFSQVEDRWATAACQTIQGMLVEQRWNAAYREQGAASLPTYDAYVENGLRSIGGPPHVWSALVTIGDPATPQSLSLLRRMERTACVCIRLANDLQSEDKEAREGKVNSLTILGHQYEKASVSQIDALARARGLVRDDIGDGLLRLGRLEKRPVTATGLPERAIGGIARFVCEFYARHDFHTFTQGAAPQGVSPW